MTGYIYPALLTALVPVRSYILDHMFDDKDLQHLDPYGESEEDYHDEQRAIHHQRNDSFDSEELDFPNRAEFRGQGLQNALRNRNRRHTLGHEMELDVTALDITSADVTKALTPVPPMELVEAGQALSAVLDVEHPLKRSDS